MAKLELFQIVFDHPQGVHFAGQWLRGSVHVTLNAPMKLRGIRLNLLGRSKVHWSTQSGDDTTNYRSDEVYFDETVMLFGNDMETVTLDSGWYKYPFELLLPDNLPSSFEGQHGYVRYIAHATIDRTWKFDSDAKEAFTVLRSLDLNKESGEYREPGILDGVEEASCCCCVSGNVNVNITLNKRCFVPGEYILISGHIANNSNAKIDRTRCALKQYTEFRAARSAIFSSGKLHTKVVSSTVQSIQGEGISGHCVDEWNNVPFLIPSLPPSRLDGCDIIEVNYVIRFYVDSDYASMKLDVPIIIGTIPLDGAFSIPPSPAVMAEPTAPPVEGFADISPAPPPYSSLLPTYEECIQGKVLIKEEEDSEYTRGNMSWAPMYTTYQFSNPSGTIFPLQVTDPSKRSLD